MPFIDKLARLIPRSLADKMVKHDMEEMTKVAGKTGKAREVAMQGAIDENQVQAFVAAVRAVPFLGAAMPVLQFATYPEATAEAMVSGPAEAAKIGIAGTVLPIATTFGGPAVWAVNATVNLGWALTDLAQAAAWAKIKNDSTG